MSWHGHARASAPHEVQTRACRSATEVTPLAPVPLPDSRELRLGAREASSPVRYWRSGDRRPSSAESVPDQEAVGLRFDRTTLELHLHCLPDAPCGGSYVFVAERNVHRLVLLIGNALWLADA
eukprot:scaffold689_cov375-Prasinococcus_capsulatus_cf.AAC.16